MNLVLKAPAPQERRPTEAIARQSVNVVGRGSRRATPSLIGDKNQPAMKIRPTSRLILFLLALFGSTANVLLFPSRAQNLIVNGSFETPAATSPYWFFTIPGGSNGLAPWVVSSNSIDVVNSSNYTDWAAPAFDDAQAVDLDGTPGPGQIAQTFPTVPGTVYRLSFAYGNNFDNQRNPSAAVRIYDESGESLGPLTITHSTSTQGNLDWQVFATNFTANGTSSTLEFTSLTPPGSGGADNGGILLDGIVITGPASPAPPIISIISPTNGAIFLEGATITIIASVTNGTGLVTNVQFYAQKLLLVSQSSAPYSVVWSNATNGSYALTAVAYASDGLSATSSPVTISVTAIPPSITEQPANLITNQGVNVAFTVAAAGSPPLSFQWQFNGTNIPGQTGPSLTFPSAAATNIGYYSVVVSNAAGTATSGSASLTFFNLKMYAGITITSPVATNYSLQAIPAFGGTNWTTLTNVFLGLQPYLYIDYNSPTNAIQFYRAVTPP
jgi:hypothetical protein